MEARGSPDQPAPGTRIPIGCTSAKEELPVFLVPRQHTPRRLGDLLTTLGACAPRPASAEAGSQHLLGATSAVDVGGVQWAPGEEEESEQV